MGFIAESKRQHFWFGTEQLMQWLPTPNRGAQTGSEGWTAEGQLLNGGSSQLGSFGSHREYVFEWPSTSTAKASQTMKSYADGTFGRGLIYFLDPLIYTTNIFPAMWADPSMGVGQEGATLVYGIDPTALPTSGREQNELPVNSAYYDLTSVSAGWRGKEDAIFLPVPEGYTLSLGAIYSSTGSGGVFYRTQTKTGALGAVTSLTALTPSTSTLVNTFIGASDLAGVWVYVGKSSAGASSVTATAMTARLLPSVAAVVTPVYKNHAPSLYGPTVPVEVRRNLATNPRMLSNASLPLNNWPAANTLTKSAPLPVPHPQGIVTGAKSVSDGSSTELLSVYGVDNLTAAGSPERILGVWVLVTEPGYRIDPFFGWPGQELTANTWTYVAQVTPIPADSWSGFQVSRIAGMASTTAACYITGCVAAPGTVPPSQFFDDQYSPDPDMTPELVPGGVGASRLTGLHPTAFTDSNCVSIIHEVGDGTRELRQIANAPSLTAETYFSVPVGVRASGTFMSVGRIETPSPNSGIGSFSRQLIVSNPSHYSAEMANVAGLTQLRRTYVSLTDIYRARLRGQFGSGDVYWSKIGLFEGDYQGPWFDGDSGVFSIGTQLVRAQWDGVPYQSTATASPTSPELEAIGTGPWIGGQGHSGCRFIRKPTETKNGPFNGGQVGFAASFTEVGSWLYG